MYLSLFNFFNYIKTMKYKVKTEKKKKNDNKIKSKIKAKKEIKKKKEEKKNIKKPKAIKLKKEIKNKNIKNKDIPSKKVDISKENNIDNQITFEKLAPFPLEFYFDKDLIHENLGLCSTFINFKSIQDILTLVYVTNDYSIVFYDIVQNKQLNIIKNPQKDIFKLIHCLDTKNKRDLILSQTCNNNIKIWNNNNYECILDLKEMELNYVSVAQVSFMNYKQNIYIISSPFSKPICNIFDLSGNKIKEINFESNINYLITYNDDELSKVYIIISSSKMIQSYNYDEDKTYHSYLNIGRNYIYNLMVVNKDRLWEPTHLFGNYGNYVIIWNFHTGEILNNVSFDVNINNICLWNNQFLIAITENFNENKDIISLLDINTGKLKKNLISHEDCKYIMISKINYPDYGEGLIALTRSGKINLYLTQVTEEDVNEKTGFSFDFTSYIADLVYNQIKDKNI